MKQTWKRVAASFANFPVKVDQYITVVIQGIPKDPFDEAHRLLLKDNGFLTLTALRKHEQKWSITNCALQFSSQFNEPLRSKDSLLIHFGFRIVKCNPIFSEHNQRGDKHKFMRFWNPVDKFAVATVFGPICYPPCPVLCFKTTKLGDGPAELVAFGSALMPNPNRVILKKVVLTGHLYRIHKKQAVVRFMFYNPADVLWFKPVQLRTKLGQVGNITGPLGTRGYMKCQFSNALHADDRVYLCLYKRVFPKWTTVPCSWITQIEEKYKTPSLDVLQLQKNRKNNVLDNDYDDDEDVVPEDESTAQNEEKDEENEEDEEDADSAADED
jgi:pre-rRNA-processing protein TSR1